MLPYRIPAQKNVMTTNYHEMCEKASAYLHSIVEPLTLHGIDIAMSPMPPKPGDSEFEGVNLAVVPKRDFEVGRLVGVGAAHVEAIRTLMRTWSGAHTDYKLQFNVMIARHNMIQTEYVDE